MCRRGRARGVEAVCRGGEGGHIGRRDSAYVRLFPVIPASFLDY